MTGGSRADSVHVVGRRRAVKLSDLVGFGLSDTSIIHAIRVYLECILDVFWMMITMFQSDYRDIRSHDVLRNVRKIHIFVLYCLTDGREHVVRVSVRVGGVWCRPLRRCVVRWVTATATKLTELGAELLT